MSALSEKLHDEERGDGTLQVRLRQTPEIRVSLLRQTQQKEVQHPGSRATQASYEASRLQYLVLKRIRYVELRIHASALMAVDFSFFFHLFGSCLIFFFFYLYNYIKYM